MKRITIGAAMFTAAIFLFTQCANEKKSDTSDVQPTVAQYGGYESQAKWGEHLVTVGACGDCHTPKKMTDHGPVEDSALLLSGHPAQLPIPPVDRLEMEAKNVAVTQTLTSWIGPWGVSFSANLTPDSTGIGAWKEEQFIYALRNGVTKGIAGSRPILEPMPWRSFRFYSDEELKAIFSYLKTVKAIKNIVQAPMPRATK